jgi:hypothetical protein
MKALLNMLLGRRRRAEERVPPASPAGKACRLFHETKICLFSETEVSSAEILFSSLEDFTSWCGENNYRLHTIVARPAVLMDDDDPGDEEEATVLTSLPFSFGEIGGITFAQILSCGPQSITLSKAHYGGYLLGPSRLKCGDTAVETQREFMRFCRLACASSSTHSILLRVATG